MNRKAFAVSFAAALLLSCISAPAASEIFTFTLDADVHAYTGNTNTGFTGRSALTSDDGVAPDASDAQVIGGFVDGTLWGGGFTAPYGDVVTPGAGIRANVPSNVAGRPYTLSFDIYVPTGGNVNFARGMLWWQSSAGWPSAVEQTTSNSLDTAILDDWQTLSFSDIVPTNGSDGLPIDSVACSLNIGSNQMATVTAYVRNVRLEYEPRLAIFASAVLSGTDIVITITNGPPDEFFDLLGSDDVAAPLGSWSIVRSALQFDAQGTATIIEPIGSGQQYFQILETGDGSIKFEFNVSDGADWDGQINSPSTSGTYFFNNQNDETLPGTSFIMNPQTSQTLVMFHVADPPDSPHAIQSAFTVQNAAGVDHTFSVTSLRYYNDSFFPGSATLRGYSGGTAGTMEWEISGDHILEDILTTATTGTLSNEIDLIVWHTPDYEDGIFGSSLDDLVIANPVPIDTPPDTNTIVFDWAEVDTTQWWTTGGYQETNNGVVLVSAGRAFATSSEGGIGLKATYAQDTNAATYTVQVAGVGQQFTVESVDLRANNAFGDVTNSWEPTVQGFLGEVMVWEIAPAMYLDWQTYSSATTGDMGQAIDTIVWNTGEAVDPNNTWGNQMDNLTIANVQPPVSPPNQATFDWAEATGNWWENAGYTETDNGITMVTRGRNFAHPNGNALKPNYPQDADPGYFNIEVEGVGKQFTVASIDYNARDGATPDSAYLVGTLSGVEQWRIDPDASVGTGFVTYTSATSGDLSLAIDEIVWHGPSEDPGGTVWDNGVDNLTVNVVP